MDICARAWSSAGWTTACASRAKSPIPLNRWSHVALTYDGSRLASGVRLYLDGRLLAIKVHLDYMNQPFDVKQPLRIGGGLGAGKPLPGAIAGVRVYRSALSRGGGGGAGPAGDRQPLAQVPAVARTPAQAAKLRSCFLEQYAPEEMSAACKELLDLREQRAAARSTAFPTVMVMQEAQRRVRRTCCYAARTTGPAKRWSRECPACCRRCPPALPNNRLGLAQMAGRSGESAHRARGGEPVLAECISAWDWSRRSRISARRASGRRIPSCWTGWRRSSCARGWDMKAMQKTIVMSATYRQSSKVTPELLQKDPENRLLARGPRVRLPAEMVRDQALAISGLLVEKIGGPSVKPYQPAGSVEGAFGRRRLQAGSRRGSVPPQPVHVLEADRAAADDDEFRCGGPGGLRGARSCARTRRCRR